MCVCMCLVCLVFGVCMFVSLFCGMCIVCVGLWGCGVCVYVCVGCVFGVCRVGVYGGPCMKKSYGDEEMSSCGHVYRSLYVKKSNQIPH